MKRNMGFWDRMVRIMVSAVFFVLIISVMIRGAAAVIFGIITAFLIITGITGFCPLYLFIGISTHPKGNSEDDT